MLAPMNTQERLIADFRGTGLTVGRHPMAHRREELTTSSASGAPIELKSIPDGRFVRVAGCVIVRQRPGTAKGFVFLSLEDETGIANIIVEPELFERERQTLISESFLLIEGVLQNQDRVTSVKARHVSPLPAGAAPQSHDFHLQICTALCRIMIVSWQKKHNKPQPDLKRVCRTTFTRC